MVSRFAVHAWHAVMLHTDRIPMGLTVWEVSGERALVPVLHLLRLLISTLLLLLMLWAFHVLAPCLVSTCLIMHHCIGPRYVASSPTAPPFLKTSVVWLLISSLLLVLLPFLEVLWLCLSFLCLCRLLFLPFILGDRRWPAYITVLMTFCYLLRLHLRLVWLLRLHGVYCWSSLAHGRHLKLQCIQRSF